MKSKSILHLSLIACAAAAATAAAAADIGGGLSVNGGATLISDYRFRGISQTDKRFAVQGTFTLAHASGFYATVWGSSIDDYIANGSDQEIDLIGGWNRNWGGTRLDVGVLYYYYPGSHGANTDFAEPYVDVSETLGPLTAKLTANYAWSQHALAVPGHGKEDNLYLAGDLSAGIPTTRLGVSAHLGHTFGPSYLSVGKEYTDWNVGLTYTTGPLAFGVSYVDTNKDAFSPAGRNITKAGVVGSVGVSF